MRTTDIGANAAGNDYAEMAALVQSIQRDDPDGMAELYRILSGGVRYHLLRTLGGQDHEDKLHDTFLIVVQAIRNGELRDPERLMGFVRTVTIRQVLAQIKRAVRNRGEPAPPKNDPRPTPLELAITRQRQQVGSATLHLVSKRDREILTRFYLKEESQEEIRSEMKLSETQFRLLKSRARARFGEMGRTLLRKAA